MRWFEFAFAMVYGLLFTAFHFLPGSWCEPLPIRVLAGVFVVATTAVYLFLVDDERRPLVGAWHRIFVGVVTGNVVAAISGSSGELYFLLTLVGAMLGFIGFRWLKHVPF
ncbi:MAG: hypothetical protein E6Q34_07495 [Burkholderiaceae bacterium]|nr:MAG: hypothetical protein E6Q34_07495 [Burkholderiaceae bacterium]